MTLKIIYIIRHGHRNDWIDPHSKSPTGILGDPQLSDYGVEQSIELKSYFDSFEESKKPQFILSSPFYRCIQTVVPLSKSLSIPIAVDLSIGEWFSKKSKIKSKPLCYKKLIDHFNCLIKTKPWNGDNTIGIKPNPEGESEDEIILRAKNFWSQVFKIIEKNHYDLENLLIVTHAATKIALGQTLLGLKSVYDFIDDEKNVLHTGLCSVDKFVYSNNIWKLEMNGNVEFLKNKEEMNWNFFC